MFLNFTEEVLISADSKYARDRERLGQRLHGTGSVCNRYEIGTDKSYVYTGPGGSGTDRINYLVPNRSPYEGGSIRNRAVLVSNRFRVNRVDLYHSRSDPKRI